MTTETKTKPVLNDLAKRHLEAAGNDREAAFRGAIAEVYRDKALRDLVLQEALYTAIYYHIGKDLSEQRRNAVAGALRIATEVSVVAIDQAREVCSSLMDFPMRSGQVLAMSNRSEVLETASWYLRTASIHAHRGRWLNMVAGKLPSGAALVGSVLSREEVQALYRNAAPEER